MEIVEIQEFSSFPNCQTIFLNKRMLSFINSCGSNELYSMIENRKTLDKESKYYQKLKITDEIFFLHRRLLYEP